MVFIDIEKEFIEVPKYKKKKENSSKANKRSDHKHEYTDIIQEGWLFGFQWAQRCDICGRIKTKSYGMMHEGLKRDNYEGKYISKNTYLSLEEIHEKYPDVKIYRRKRKDDGMVDWDADLEEIVFE